MQRFIPEKIVVEAGVADEPLTRTVLDRCAGVSCQIIPSAPEYIRTERERGGHGFEKKTLLLCRNKGRFLEPCPGTREYLCCGYMILTPGIGCPLDCSYCVLQAYLNNPFVTLYMNLADMVQELEALPPGIVRIGTGEFMDSLALDHLTGFSKLILPALQRQKGLVLELKTKTDITDNLLELDHREAYVVSWSLNTIRVASTEERGAAAVPARIAAARRLVGCGYRVGFHFDPLILYSGCVEEYHEVIGLLEHSIPPEAIAWVSIGSLRYMPHLKKVALQRFPETTIFTGELVPGRDGKMRYLQKLRLELYKSIVDRLRRWAGDMRIYFCMEDSVVWKKTLGFVPAAPGGLKAMLDQAIQR